MAMATAGGRGGDTQRMAKNPELGSDTQKRRRGSPLKAQGGQRNRIRLEVWPNMAIGVGWKGREMEEPIGYKDWDRRRFRS